MKSAIWQSDIQIKSYIENHVLPAIVKNGKWVEDEHENVNLYMSTTVLSGWLREFGLVNIGTDKSKLIVVSPTLIGRLRFKFKAYFN